MDSPGTYEGDRLRRNGMRKLGTARRLPRLVMSQHSEGGAYNSQCGEVAARRRVGRMGRLSDDGPGQHNPDRSEGPWGSAAGPRARRCRRRVRNLNSVRGRNCTSRRHEGRRQTTVGMLSIPYLGKAPTDSRPWSRIGENPPYGILGRAMETSASCEARLAPSLYPTEHPGL